MPSINAYNKYNKYLKSRNISSPKKATVEKLSNVICTPCQHISFSFIIWHGMVSDECTCTWVEKYVNNNGVNW